MKKFASVFVALMLVAVTAVTAFAAGINKYEQNVIDELNTTVQMKGTTMRIPVEFVNQAENYFNTIEMTEQESKEIIAILKEGETFIQSTGADNIYSMTIDQKRKLLDYGKQVVGVIGMKMTYDNSKKMLYIYDPAGNTAFAAKPHLVPVSNGSSGNNGNNADTSKKDNSGVIKTTGAEANFGGFAAVGAVAVLLVAGCAVYFVKTKKEA